MDNHAVLAARFKWAQIVVRSLVQVLAPAQLERTLLCHLQGSDSDFTGGAAAWEHASQMLEAAASEYGLPCQLQPRSVCEACFRSVSIFPLVRRLTKPSTSPKAQRQIEKARRT